MSAHRFSIKSRRGFLAGSAAMLATPALAQSTSSFNSSATTETERDLTESVQRNVSSFRMLDWRPYFSNTRNGAVLVDIDSRAVHYWSEDQSVYKLYPSSVPLTEDLTRRGRTRVIKRSRGQAGVPRLPCSSAIPSGRPMSGPARITRWAPMRCTSAGRITVSTEPTTQEKLGVSLPMVALGSITNILPNFLP